MEKALQRGRKEGSRLGDVTGSRGNTVEACTREWGGVCEGGVEERWHIAINEWSLEFKSQHHLYVLWINNLDPISLTWNSGGTCTLIVISR